MKIRKMVTKDINGAAKVHQEAFPRQTYSKEWIKCNLMAYPRIQYFVAEDESGVVGFIQWTQQSGFRPEVVLELEQIAVRPKSHGQGIGSSLIQESLSMVRDELRERGAKIKHIIVTTRSDNAAQSLYQRTIGVEVEAKITDLFSGDEVFMIARNVEERKL